MLPAVSSDVQERVGKLTEENMADALKEVRAALLAADVHFKVALRGYHELTTQMYFAGESFHT